MANVNNIGYVFGLTSLRKSESPDAKPLQIATGDWQHQISCHTPRALWACRKYEQSQRQHAAHLCSAFSASMKSLNRSSSDARLHLN